MALRALVVMAAEPYTERAYFLPTPDKTLFVKKQVLQYW